MFKPKERRMIKSIIVILILVVLMAVGLLCSTSSNTDDNSYALARDYEYDPMQDVYKIAIYNNGDIEVITGQGYIHQLSDDTVIITNLEKYELISKIQNKFE